MTDAQLKRLTKAQLIEKINRLEAEIDSLYYEQRPSRTVPQQQDIERITYTVRGVCFEKTRPRGARVWIIRVVE